MHLFRSIQFTGYIYIWPLGWPARLSQSAWTLTPPVIPQEQNS